RLRRIALIPYTISLNHTATTELYTLSLHDALPISVISRSITEDPRPLTHTRPSLPPQVDAITMKALAKSPADRYQTAADFAAARSEEHTSELQSRENLVCRLLLEKKKETATGRRLP